MIHKKYLFILAVAVPMLLFNNCGKPKSDEASTTPGITNTPTPTPTPALTCLEQHTTVNNEWSNDTQITINGYAGQAMEPQISADGNTLFFNDKYPGDTDMDIHYALKSTNTVFNYVGKLAGASELNIMDGVPAIDASNRFYFMSLRDYSLGGRYRSIFKGDIALGGNGLVLNNVTHADANFSAGTPPSGGVTYIEMDIGVSWDGTLAVVASTEFLAGAGYPRKSWFHLYDIDQVTRQLSLHANSEAVLANINVPECKVYAPVISIDKKELYYTFLQYNGTGSAEFRVAVAKRSNTTEPFGKGAVISAISGYGVEGPSISYVDGGKTLYYHKRDPIDGIFKIYKLTRP